MLSIYDCQGGECMEKRKLKVIFGKDGRGATNTKITLPVTWLKEMNITQDEREVSVEYDSNKKIIIIKKEN